MSITASSLNKVLESADIYWADNQAKADYVANAEIVRVVKANDTAVLTPLLDPAKDNVVKIAWINACDVEAVDFVGDCDFTGVPLTTDSKEYALDITLEVTSSISEQDLRTNLFSFEQFMAKQFLKADKALTEK